jgi:hypothetical protein
MKQNRRPIRPRPTRPMINILLQCARSAIQIHELDWTLEARKTRPSFAQLRCLQETIGKIKDEIALLEQL